MNQKSNSKKEISKKKVFISRKIHSPAFSMLKKNFQVKVYQKDQIITKKELIAGVKDCDALLCLLTDKIDKEIIDASPHLKVISNYAVGFDNIDVEYATKKGIVVGHTPSQEVVNAVAEHTFTLILSLAKLIRKDELWVRENKWSGWDPMLLLGEEIKGKTLGIIGLGRIGSGVVQRAHCLGMQILYHDVIRNKKFERKYHAKFIPIDEVLKRSDFVSLHTPLLKETFHLIGRKELGLMKKTAYLINTARGEVIDEKALITALQHKKIAGAGLDVFEKSPQVDKRLIKMDNVVLTPHTASATIEVRKQMSIDAANNIIAVLQGKKAPKTVNPEVYKKRKKFLFFSK